MDVTYYAGYMRYTCAMTVDYLQQNWALLAASVIGLAIILFLIARVLQDSRRGRLAEALRHLQDREKALKKARRDVDKAGSRLEKLQAKGDSVPPNRLLAAKDALAADEETARLLDEQVQVVRNNARTMILEDYPPKRHAAMLKRLLGEAR